MRVRLVFVLIALLALTGVFFWHSPYHQVRSIVTVVDINAPGDRVWQVLTDLNGYRDWNPFLTSASGAVAPGGRITISAKVGNRTITFHPRISTVEPGKKLAWVGRLLSAEFFQGEHQFEVDRSRSIAHPRDSVGAFQGNIGRRLMEALFRRAPGRVPRHERGTEAALRTNGCEPTLNCRKRAKFSPVNAETFQLDT